MMNDKTTGEVRDAPPDWYDYDESSHFTPAEICRQLDDYVEGQLEAKKACALTFWNLMAHKQPRPSVNLFIGPTGSGKTMIWQTLQKIYPTRGMVIIEDCSALSAQGWRGRNLSDIFKQYAICGNNKTHEYDKRAVIVLDEWDKTLCPAISSGGTDSHQLLNQNFLKLFNGDVIDYESGDKHIRVNAKNLAFVLCGCFSGIHEQKEKRGIGFNSTTQPENKKPISTEDLIKYGAPPEIVGRINRIVQLDEPDLETMAAIGRKAALNMSLEYGTNITVAPDTLQDMAQKAIDSGLGGRYMRTQIQARLDEQVFAHPFASHYIIGDEPEREKEKDCFA